MGHPLPGGGWQGELHPLPGVAGGAAPPGALLVRGAAPPDIFIVGGAAPPGGTPVVV